MRPMTRDERLREYATDRQWEALEALWAEGTDRAAAKRLGVNHTTILGARRAVLNKAARCGYVPDNHVFNSRAGTPPGYVLRGQSAMVDGDGSLLKRWDKTRQEGMDPDAAHKLPDPKKTTKLSTMTDADGRVVVQWISEKPEDVARETAWRDFAKELAADLPRAEPIKTPKPGAANLMAVYPVGDHHLGMYAWHEEAGGDYDMKIGERLICGAVDHLVAASPACDEAAVVFLGDFLHYDSMVPVTPTNRNPLDSDSRFGLLVRVAVRSMRHVVNAALVKHAHVRVVVEIGNHDLVSSIFLMECLASIYENEPRITVDKSPRHFHYFRHGRCLVGVHHGHGVKLEQLPLVMATDRAEDWGATAHRYWLTGHIHKDRVLDVQGVRVESFRVLPPNDAWAENNGYRSKRGMVGIVLHDEHGEVARNTVHPDMLKEKEKEK